MDPQATFAMLLDAFANNEYSDACERAEDLLDWTRRDGSRPIPDRQQFISLLAIVRDYAEALNDDRVLGLAEKDQDELEEDLSDDDEYDVSLEDEGTLDTVVRVTRKAKSHVIRFSDTSDYRDEHGSFTDEGWEDLCEEAISEFENLCA